MFKSVEIVEVQAFFREFLKDEETLKKYEFWLRTNFMEVNTAGMIFARRLVRKYSSTCEL